MSPPTPGIPPICDGASISDGEEHGHTDNLTAVSRRRDCAPHGIGVKTRAADAVDLRSSLDSDLLAAFVRIYAGNGDNRSQTGPAEGVDTAPPLQE